MPNTVTNYSFQHCSFIYQAWRDYNYLGWFYTLRDLCKRMPNKVIDHSLGHYKNQIYKAWWYYNQLEHLNRLEQCKQIPNTNISLVLHIHSNYMPWWYFNYLGQLIRLELCKWMLNMVKNYSLVQCSYSNYNSLCYYNYLEQLNRSQRYHSNQMLFMVTNYSQHYCQQNYKKVYQNHTIIQLIMGFKSLSYKHMKVDKFNSFQVHKMENMFIGWICKQFYQSLIIYTMHRNTKQKYNHQVHTNQCYMGLEFKKLMDTRNYYMAKEHILERYNQERYTREHYNQESYKNQSFKQASYIRKGYKEHWYRWMEHNQEGCMDQEFLEHSYTWMDYMNLRDTLNYHKVFDFTLDKNKEHQQAIYLFASQGHTGLRHKLDLTIKSQDYSLKVVKLEECNQNNQEYSNYKVQFQFDTNSIKSNLYFDNYIILFCNQNQNHTVPSNYILFIMYLHTM